MADDLEAVLKASMWVPRDRREVMLRTLQASGREGRALLPAALATQSVPDARFARAMPVIEKRR